MNECECLPRCPFFHDKMDDMPVMADMYKHKYCLGDAATCARHMVFEVLGREAVPTDLFPNDVDYANKVLAAG